MKHASLVKTSCRSCVAAAVVVEQACGGFGENWLVRDGGAKLDCWAL